MSRLKISNILLLHLKSFSLLSKLCLKTRIDSTELRFAFAINWIFKYCRSPKSKRSFPLRFQTSKAFTNWVKLSSPFRLPIQNCLKLFKKKLNLSRRNSWTRLGISNIRYLQRKHNFACLFIFIGKVSSWLTPS